MVGCMTGLNTQTPPFSTGCVDYAAMSSPAAAANVQVWYVWFWLCHLRSSSSCTNMDVNAALHQHHIVILQNFRPTTQCSHVEQ